MDILLVLLYFTSDLSLLSIQMPRPRPDYDPEVIMKAYHAVQAGMSVNQAAKEFGVARTTLRDRVEGRVKVGHSMKDRGNRNTKFSPEEEVKLSEHLYKVTDAGYYLSQRDLRRFAFDYAVHLKKKNCQIPPNRVIPTYLMVGLNVS